MQCKKCNQIIPDTATHCAYCGTPTAGEALSGITSTTRGKRFANYTLDFIGMWGMEMLLNFSGLSYFIMGPYEGSWILYWFMFPFLYYFVTESLFSKSPAKFLTKTRVVSESGGKPTATGIAIRSLVRVIPLYALFFFFTAKGPRPVGWHDRLAHIRVVDDK